MAVPSKSSEREKFSASVAADIYEWTGEMKTIFGSRSKLVEIALRRLRQQIEEDELTVYELVELYGDEE